MNYQPGLHIIAEFSSPQKELLEKSSFIQQLLHSQINKYGLNKLGEVFHDFDPAGYTAVICLSESHISLHSWPEYNRINLDIYLSNYQQNNDQTGQRIYEELIRFFDAEVIACQQIKR